MMEVVMCIGRDHDPWLVLLAVFVCGTGAFAIVQMFGRARATVGVQRFAWLFLTSVGAGATIWCTHFVAMLAFRAGVPVSLDPVLTVVSLIDNRRQWAAAPDGRHFVLRQAVGLPGPADKVLLNWPALVGRTGR